MIRVTLSFDQKTQTLTSVIADTESFCLLASIVIAYDNTNANKVKWNDVLVTNHNSNAELKELIKKDSGSLVGGVFLRYLAESHTEGSPLDKTLKGLSHPIDILMTLGTFTVTYDIKSPQKLIELAKFFSNQTAPTHH
jgi:hypothetical protein